MAQQLRPSVVLSRGHKVCKGPTHDQPTILPTGAFYQRRRFGKVTVMGWCKTCHAWRKNNPLSPAGRGYIPMEEFMPIRDELCRRIGPTEAARRIGINYIHLAPYQMNKKKSVRWHTYHKAVAVLADARAKGEDGWSYADARQINLRPADAGRASWSEESRARRAVKVEKARAAREHAKALKSQSISLRPKVPSNRSLETPLMAYYMERNQVDMSPPDPAWWVHDGYTYVPRYGEQMLGADF